MDKAPRTLKIDGIEYLAGTAGSLILACDGCGEEHARHPRGSWMFNPEWHRCWNKSCPKRELVDHLYRGNPLQPIRMDELESRWKPFWRRLGRLEAEDA